MPSSPIDMPLWLVPSKDGELIVRPPMLRTVDGLSVSGCLGTAAAAAAAVVPSGDTFARP